jgi:ethanolamine utilization protein EutQ
MKTLVSASTIRELKDQGETRIAAPLASAIVTPEARDLAAKLGILIDETVVVETVVETIVDGTGDKTVDKQANSSANDNASGNQCTVAPKVVDGSCPINKIQQAVTERLPAAGVDPALIEQLVRKAMQEMDAPATSGSCQRQVAENGVVLVRGNSVRMGHFDGAPGKNIGLTDVITGGDHANMSAGYMAWDNAFFPWTLNYDEIDIVLEGELHIRAGGTTYIGKPGDVFFVPNGASIEFGTPSSVRFVYVTYPADWAG